jgi:small subunit ribosomal protein S3e
VFGIRGKVRLDWDQKGKQGPAMPLPHIVTIHPPKEEDELLRPVIPEIPAA